MSSEEEGLEKEELEREIQWLIKKGVMTRTWDAEKGDWLLMLTPKGEQLKILLQEDTRT